jgi:hypothetical protein
MTVLSEGITALCASPVWSDAEVARTGLSVLDVPFVTIGGGLASFAVVGFLRNCRVPAAEIRVISPQSRPYENFHYLMRRSQILDSDPLRSDSMSRVDNIWGFPSYAVERSMAKRRPGTCRIGISLVIRSAMVRLCRSCPAVPVRRAVHRLGPPPCPGTLSTGMVNLSRSLAGSKAI